MVDNEDDISTDLKCTDPQKAAYILIIVGVLFLISGGITGFSADTLASTYLVIGAVLLTISLALLFAGLVTCCVIYGKCRGCKASRKNVVEEGTADEMRTANGYRSEPINPVRTEVTKPAKNKDTTFNGEPCRG